MYGICTFVDIQLKHSSLKARCSLVVSTVLSVNYTPTQNITPTKTYVDKINTGKQEPYTFEVLLFLHSVWAASNQMNDREMYCGIK